MIEEWKAWAQHHIRLFGLQAIKGATDTLMEWADLFARLEYTPAEMREASEFIALDPPRYYTEQLGALQARVRDQRIRAIAHRNTTHWDRGTCEMCGNTGRVIVPGEGLPTPRDNIMPAGAMLAVLCRCAIGESMKSTKGKPQLTLVAYEARYPNWRGLMLEIEGLTHQHARADEAARTLDGRFAHGLDAVLHRLKIKTQKPGR